MTLDAQQVEALQNSTPTDWTKFDQTVGADARRFGQATGGLPPGMGPGHDDPGRNSQERGNRLA